MSRPELKDLKVQRVQVGMDYDVKGDGNMANASCLPLEMSNDRAFEETRAIGGENAVCVTFSSEVGGVVGDQYTNCITASGRLVSLDKDGTEHRGFSSTKGGDRLALILAQTHDCFLLQTRPNEFANYLWNNAGHLSQAQLSPLMRKYVPQMKKEELPVDIDQDAQGKYAPTIGAVTVGTGMVDDKVAVEPVTEKGLTGVCLMFNSEVAEPYGNGAAVNHAYGTQRVCLMEDGKLRATSPDGRPVKFDQARMVQNFGTVINRSFNGPSPEALAMIELAKEGEKISAQSDQVEEGHSMEERGFLKIWSDSVRKDFQEPADACLKNVGVCNPRDYAH